jgi:hypothetical protein
MVNLGGASLVCNWEAIIANWDSVLSTSRKTILRSLRMGIPSKHRPVLWQLLTGAREAKQHTTFTYPELVLRPTHSEDIIYCDVPRTCPALHDPKFSASLRNVLVAYSNADPVIGYVQGMNFIAALFVRYEDDEETAFWCFYGLFFCDPKPYRPFFELNFPTLRDTAELVDQLLIERFPSVACALKDHGMNSIVIVPHWFNSCFMGTAIEARMATFLFDQFLAFGVPVLLSFGMATVSFMSEVLEKGEFEDFLTVATSPGRALAGKSRQEVNMAWNREWITTTKYQQLCAARNPHKSDNDGIEKVPVGPR